MFISPPTRAAEHRRATRIWPALCLGIAASLALAVLPVTPAFADSEATETAAVESVESAPVESPPVESVPVESAPVESVEVAAEAPAVAVEPAPAEDAAPASDVVVEEPAASEPAPAGEPAAEPEASTSEPVMEVMTTTTTCDDIMATTTDHGCDPCAEASTQRTIIECDPCAEASAQKTSTECDPCAEVSDQKTSAECDPCAEASVQMTNTECDPCELQRTQTTTECDPCAEASDQKTNTECDPCELQRTQPTTECDPCAEASDQKTTTECDPCEENAGLTVTSGKHDSCIPTPLIEIDLMSICPVAIEITISGLVEEVAYRYFVGDVEYYPTVSEGTATIALDGATGNILVAVTYGERDVSKYSWFPPLECPTIGVWIDQCTTIEGAATLFVDVTGLLEGWDYTVEVTGPDFLYTTSTEGMSSWWSWFELPPGDYTVTVWSASEEGPAIGPVHVEATLEPCPADVVITIVPRCGSATAGTLGASLSGLVIGREYTVTVEGVDGLISEVTFVATSTGVDVTPTTLPPGTYTVTVIDTMSGESPSELRAALIVETLRWSAEASITVCPPLPSAGGRPVPALAVTGSTAGSPLSAALLLLPLGGLFMAAAHVATRRRAVRDRVTEP